jgi:hypothetical protein
MDSLTHSIFKPQTKTIRKTQFIFFLLVSLLLALCVLMPGKAMAEKEKPVQTAELGKFKVLPKGSADAFTLDIQHKGKSIIQSKAPVKMISYDEVQKDVPLPGCESLKVNLTEGNNSSYYLLSSCKDKDFAAYIKPFDGEVVFNPELKTYTATDPFFMAYEPKLATSDGGMALSRETHLKLPGFWFLKKTHGVPIKPKNLWTFTLPYKPRHKVMELMPALPKALRPLTMPPWLEPLACSLAAC